VMCVMDKIPFFFSDSIKNETIINLNSIKNLFKLQKKKCEEKNGCNNNTGPCLSWPYNGTTK
jgi:hypothetical protein